MSILIVQIVFASIALIAFLRTLKYLNPLKLIKHPPRLLLLILNSGMTLMLGFLLFTSLSYNSTRFKEPVAKVYAKAIDSQHYVVSVQLLDNAPITYDLYGDMWQIDLKLLVWSEFWNVFGLHTLYQLDRLSGRYIDITDEKAKKRSVYELRGYKLSNELHSFWQFLDRFNLLPGLEVKYGNAAFVPLADGAEYEVIVLRSGVQIKPLNSAAQSSIDSW